MILLLVLPAVAAALLRGATAEDHAGLPKPHDVDKRDALWHLGEMLDQFAEFANTTNATVVNRHAGEDVRLKRAFTSTTDSVAQMALMQSITENEASLREEQMVFAEMLKFIGTLDGVIGRVPIPGSGRSCKDVTCGEHASCSRTTMGAECVCDEGFEGDGMSCTAPSLFVPQRLLRDGLRGRSSRIADVSVNMFMGYQLVVAFRDISNFNVGTVMIGDFTDGHIHWSPPEKFAELKAFDPVAVGMDTNRIVIAYRDDDREATLFLRAGELDASGVRGTTKHITWGEPLSVARMQAHRAALLNLGPDKAVVFYKDFRPATKETPERHFCAAGLANVGKLGALSELGTFHFLEFAATRLTAKLLTPTSFVVGYRGTKAVDDLDASIVRRQEASVIYGELVETELVFDPHPVDLEPDITNVWDRGLSVVGPHTFGYAYQTGVEQGTHLAVITVDPVTHHMKVLSRNLLSKGFSPFVKMVDIPYSPDDPHSLALYQEGDKNVANVCDVDLTLGNLTRCEEMVWMDRKLSTVATATLGSGRTLLVFADDQGVPYYHVIMLSKK
jgi:hypothetical protein